MGSPCKHNEPREGCSQPGMGNTPSLPAGVLQRLVRATRFEEEDITRLYERFMTVDTDQSGKLTQEEFLQIPEFAVNPLAARILQATHNMGEAMGGSGAPGELEEIDFEQFVMMLDVFSPSASTDSKLELLFRAFDLDQDGYVGVVEIEEMWKSVVHVPMTEDQRQRAAQQVLDAFDTDKDGQWSR